MSTDIVPVGLGERSYDIHIGSGLLDQAGKLIFPLMRQKQAFIISDETVAALYHERLVAALTACGVRCIGKILPPGEKTKDFIFLQEVLDTMLRDGCERGVMVIALGGGVIGDLTGFSASVLLRVVYFVQIPTTLLAQVDSSVGGKTGINTAQGKNLIGAFHQPSLVLADIDLLGTLTARDFIAGYGEVVKYGLLGDAQFFDWLEANGPALAAGDTAARLKAVRRSVEMKAGIVARDETEEGERALLNLGHTFCHALESATGYGARLLHGEGVAIGCALAFELSQRLGLCSQEAPSRVRAHLKAMGMKTDLADIDGPLPDADGLIALMAQDKKVLDGKMRFILARGIGEAFVTSDVPRDVLKRLLEDALETRRA